MRNLRIKKVLRLSRPERKFRLFRFMWERGQMMHGGYSAKLAVSLVPKLIEFKFDANGWRATLIGIQAHLRRNYGGLFV